MRAMLMQAPHTPLELVDLPNPSPHGSQVLLKINACGICHTDLHILDGELSNPKLPLVLGHQIVARVIELGPLASRFHVGDRVGVPWLGSVDGTCPYCLRGQENLCDFPLFTGYDLNGGFAEYTVADERFCFHLPPTYLDNELAPLLCAGLIGYRTYRMAGEQIDTLGIFGFGAAAHLITQVAKFEGKKVYAFTRPGDKQAQDFALQQGVDWVGYSSDSPPQSLDAALIFAPVGSLVIQALNAVRKGGVVVCGGIHMSDIPSFPYSLLWEERIIRSVANLSRQDGENFFSLVPKVPVKAKYQAFFLEEVNYALHLLRSGDLNGAGVIDVISSTG